MQYSIPIPKEPAAHPRMLKISMKMRKRLRSDLKGMLETILVNFHKAMLMIVAITKTTKQSSTMETPDRAMKVSPIKLIFS